LFQSLFRKKLAKIQFEELKEHEDQRRCILFQSLFRMKLAEKERTREERMRRLTKKAVELIEKGEYGKARKIVEELVKVDENSCKTVILQYLVCENQKKRMEFLIKSISLNREETINIMQECLDETKMMQELETVIKTSKREEISGIKVVNNWISEFFPFVLKDVGKWEEKEIKSFFSFLNMKDQCEILLEEKYTNGNDLVRINLEVWKHSGLKARDYQYLKDLLDKFTQLHHVIPEKPWSITVEQLSLEGWVERKSKRSLSYKSLLLNNGENMKHQKEVDTVVEICKKLSMPNNLSIDKIYLIHNEQMSNCFNHNLDVIFDRWRVSPDAFRKSDWKKKSNTKLRERYMACFEKEVTKWKWNETRTV